VQVSVIIPHYGNPELTKNCIGSVDATHPEVELLVVDNSQNLPAQMWATVITPPRNLGFAAGCNLGARAAVGDVYVFLNNDCRVLDGWLAPMLKALEDPMVGVVGSRLIYPDGRIQHSGVMIDLTEPFGREAWNTIDERPSGFVDGVTGACMAMRCGDWPGFDEGFWNGYEDVDLCLRVRSGGKRCWYSAESVVVHYESQSGQERWRRVGENIGRLRRKWGAAA
jgi:GT2 family glycosyltransferase